MPPAERRADGDDARRRPDGDPRSPPTAEQSDLVAQLVGDSGLLAPEKLEAVRHARRGGSFSRALLDEGFANSLGVARNLAEQYHLPLVDLAVEGVDAEASKLIPLPVLERVCAIPFAFDGKRLRIAITEPQNVQGLDELRLATRHSTEFSVAPREDVLTEIRRLGRASEALNVALMDDAVAIARADEPRRRPRGRRRHLGRAARPARQLDHLPGGRGRRERHPLRAAGGRARRPLPDRRRAPRRRADPDRASPPA